MKEIIFKILTLLLIVIGVWIVATIGFAIFRIAMSLVVGLLTIALIVGIGFLLYKFVQK